MHNCEESTTERTDAFFSAIFLDIDATAFFKCPVPFFASGYSHGSLLSRCITEKNRLQRELMAFFSAIFLDIDATAFFTCPVPFLASGYSHGSSLSRA
ncbi:hypothetical protein HNY73_018526 [Argiope bruennichi]|uniref:Uncharacterized protein n=1 Tax=Argiope bruennichi TaxID=94029 RepID=A0A8T0ED69_ARGBR|nr:hypothetical protein HNY73_018526 [Argiope bruennichi]